MIDFVLGVWFYESIKLVMLFLLLSFVIIVFMMFCLLLIGILVDCFNYCNLMIVGYLGVGIGFLLMVGFYYYGLL